MNIRSIITSAVVGYNQAKQYEIKIYNMMEMLVSQAGNTAYVDELGAIQTASEKIIGEILGWDIYGDDGKGFEDITDKLNDEKATTKEVVDFIISKMDKGE